MKNIIETIVSSIWMNGAQVCTYFIRKWQKETFKLFDLLEIRTENHERYESVKVQYNERYEPVVII